MAEQKGDELRFSSFKFDWKNSPRKKTSKNPQVKPENKSRDEASNLPPPPAVEPVIPELPRKITPLPVAQPYSPQGYDPVQVRQSQNMVPVYEPAYTTIEEGEDTLDFRDYLGVILHRRYWLVISVLVFIAVGFFTKVNLHPAYSSTARLRVIAMTGLMDPYFGYDYVSANIIQTHMENLKSSTFLKNVVPKLDTNISLGRISGLFQVTRTKDANIINIVVTTSNPDFSSRLANIIADAYEKYDLITKQKSFKEYEAWIVGQMAIRQRTLDSLEGGIKGFYEMNPSFYTEKDEVKTFSDYENTVNAVNLELQQNNRKLFLIKKEIAGLDSQIIKEVNYEQPLKQELLSLKLELAKLRSKYQPGHFKITSIEKKMDAIRKLIRNESMDEAATTTMESNPRYLKLREEEQELVMQKDLLSTRKTELERLQRNSLNNLSLAPELELQLSQMVRKKQITEKMYLMLQEKLQETQLKKSSTPREIFQMDNAAIKGSLIPKKYMNFGTSVLIGLAVGVILCFLMDFLDTTVRKSKDLQERFGITLMGLIPKSDSGNIIEISPDAELTSPNYEPYRRLLANIFPNQSMDNKRSILVTSALQGEGKTTTAVYLAVTSALKGDKVLLIDADLRRHNIYNIFGLSNDIGLSDYLDEKKSLDQLTQKSALSNLGVLCAGTDPNSMIHSKAKGRLEKLILEAFRTYDMVIFDSPPILQLSDTLTIAPLVSKTLVVFRSKKTPIKAGEEVLRQLHYIHANVVGGVLNDVSRSFWDHYYYQYYKYGYHYKYGNKYT